MHLPFTFRFATPAISRLIFLFTEGNYKAEIFKDVANADHDATGYKREIVAVTKNTKLTIKLYPGGGCAVHIYKP
jgi:Glycosyl-hydrolase 97 C-terminal, oligomerisation